MEFKIVIPTLARMHSQHTYNSLPDKYKKQTIFIVQSQEYEEMSKLYPGQVMELPSNIKNLGKTRDWIFTNFSKYRYLVADDDLSFIHKSLNPEKKPKWITRKVETEAEFDIVFERINKWMDDGYVFGGLQPTWIVPDEKYYPMRENYRVMTNTFFNGPALVDEKLDFERCCGAEDFDTTLQLLTRGYKNILSTEYMVSCSETNAKGGCEVYRTLEYHNNAQTRLYSFWPDYVKVIVKKVKNGVWKNKEKNNVRVQWKQAYKKNKKTI